MLSLVVLFVIPVILAPGVCTLAQVEAVSRACFWTEGHECYKYGFRTELLPTQTARIERPHDEPAETQKP